MISFSTKNWQINNIDTVFFDKDGTFVDLHYFWGKMTELRVKEIIKRYSLSTDFLFPLCLTLGFDINTQKMLSNGITALYSRIKVIEIFSEDLKKYNINIKKEEIALIFDYVSKEFYKDIDEYIKPIDSAINLIKLLKSQNIKLGLITADAIESTNLTLNKLHLENIFDVIYARESCSDTKESGVPAILALKDINSLPQNTIMIGDTPSDNLCAKKANIEKTILVSSGQIDKKELLKTSPFVVEDLKEITILNTINLIN